MSFTLTGVDRFLGEQMVRWPQATLKKKISLLYLFLVTTLVGEDCNIRVAVICELGLTSSTAQTEILNLL